MADENGEPWDMKTALRRSLHIIHVHTPRKPSKELEVNNVPPVPNIPQNISKPEIVLINHGRTFKANPFADRTEGIVYQVESLDERLLDSFPSPPHQKTTLTKRKYLFFVMLAGFVFVVSMAIGLAMVLSRKQSPNPAPYPGLAVSGLFVKNVTQWNMQLFYQDMTSSAINYRISTNTINNSAAQTITLSHPPTQNVPIAAASFESLDGTTFHNVFYILNGQIVLANMTCPALTPTSCSTLTNSVISTNLQNVVAADSSIAAVFLGLRVNKGFRIFYHNTQHQVTELALLNRIQQETVLSAPAVQGNSLAAVTFSAPGYIQVTYTDAKAATLFTIENFAGNWLSSLTIPSFTPTTALTLSYAFIPDSLFLFYTTTLSTIAQFTAHNVSPSSFPAAISSNQTGRTTPGWTNTPESNEAWTKGLGPGGPVASTGWSDQVRFFQLEDGDGGGVVQNAFNT